MNKEKPTGHGQWGSNYDAQNYNTSCPASAHAIANQYSLKPRGNSYYGDCPLCGYTNSFTVKGTDCEGHGVVMYCHACQSNELYAHVVKHNGQNAKMTNWLQTGILGHAKTDPKHGRNTDRALRIWKDSQQAQGSQVEAYLVSRGLGLPLTLPLAIRYSPNLHYQQGEYYPAMVCKVTKHTGELIGLHRTYLDKQHARKAPVTPVKKSLGAIRGGSVHLARCGDTIGLCEGIETGLAAMALTGKPTWACLSTGGLMAIELPPFPLAQSVVIFADNDPPGLNAANTLAERLYWEGRTVTIQYPPQPGNDFLDVYNQQKGI